MIVLSVGGSLINPDPPDLVFVRNFVKLIKAEAKKQKIAILTGGGKPARSVAGAIRELSQNEFLADEAAILATRQNGLILIAALGVDAYPNVATSFREAAAALASHNIVVMGGTIPGITTDADAALLAEKLGAKRLVNISNIDALYSADPRKDKNAARFAELAFVRLVELASASDQRKAGTNFPFDLVACKLVSRSRIETHFVHGRDQDSIKKAIAGVRHKGTVVK